MKMVKAASLVLDFGLYPRSQVDDRHLAEMCEAERAGAEFPPVVACRKTGRVADGFHRVRKQLRVHGDDAEIACVFRDYEDDAALFLDAMRMNANHGRNLCSYDKAHCILVAERLKIPDGDVALALSVTGGRIELVRRQKTATLTVKKAPPLAVPIKRTIAHMAGKRLTPEQHRANERLGGMAQSFYANQLITLIESGLLDAEDEELMARLARLQELLEGVLAERAA